MMADVVWHFYVLLFGFVFLALFGLLVVGLHLLSEMALDYLKREHGIERQEIEGKAAIVVMITVISYCIGRVLIGAF